MEYLINLETHGITPGSFGKPPYTLDQYLKAHNNALGFNNAFQYAKSNGYDTIVFPDNIYTFCYERPSGGSSAANRDGGILSPLRGQTINWRESTFEVMYDSINRNPYDLRTTSEVYSLYHNVIWINEPYIRLLSPKIKGDIFNRAFVNALEKSQEQSYGVAIGSNADFFYISNPDIYGFMGDSICGKNTRSLDTLPPQMPDAFPGYRDNSGAVIPRDGYYVTDPVEIDLTRLKERNPRNPFTVQLKRVSGSQKTPDLVQKYYELIFLDENNTFIRRDFYTYLDLIHLPYNCKKIVLQLSGEAVGLASVTQGIYGLAFTVPMTADGRIEGGNVHDNHRGGVSNLPDRTIFNRVRFENNGRDSSIGAPIFPDTTRYGIDQENLYSSYIALTYCHFTEGFNGALLGAQEIDVNHCEFSNINGVTIYRSSTANIHDNRFKNCSLAAFQVASLAERVAGGIRLINFYRNIIQCAKAFELELHPDTEINIDNNDIITGGLTVFSKNNTFTNNRVSFNIALGITKTTTLRTYINDLKDFSNNYFKQIDDSVGVFRVYLLNTPKSSGNIFEGIYIYRSGFSTIPGDVVKSFHTRGCTFIKCIFQSATYTTPETHIYSDCVFDDTALGIPLNSTVEAPSRSKLVLNRCHLIVYEKSPIVYRGDQFTVNKNIYEVELNDCTIEYRGELKPTLINNNSASILAKILVKGRVRVINNDAFITRITNKGQY